MWFSSRTVAVDAPHAVIWKSALFKLFYARREKRAALSSDCHQRSCLHQKAFHSRVCSFINTTKLFDFCICKQWRKNLSQLVLLQAFADNPLYAAVSSDCLEKKSYLKSCFYVFVNVKNHFRYLPKQLRKLVQEGKACFCFFVYWQYLTLGIRLLTFDKALLKYWALV